MQLICPFQPKCQTKIIKFESDKPTHKLITKETTIPFLSPSNSNSNSNSSQLSNLSFHKAGMWDFDNIGVSRPIPPSSTSASTSKEPVEEILELQDEQTTKIQKFKVVRYLTCGECDRGALGFVGVSVDDDDVGAGEEGTKQKVDEMAYFVCIDSCFVDLGGKKVEDVVN
ncbi:unnamed protein product [Ambrosiozyma monospora]|uniref:Unnamed protein product n=1 Tax=Ambrosiozyma monospora TaxID=43982 RepID=A0A9W6Z1Y7_AMBMO|nr:unnamed protein product [Ambrosiozyma monospora]